MIVPDETQDIQENHTSVWLLAQYIKAIKEVNNAHRGTTVYHRHSCSYTVLKAP